MIVDSACSLSLDMRCNSRSLCENREAEYAMLMAVSGLSPVSTHTMIPASSSARTVRGTSSCSRSSTPVAPTSVRALSSRVSESRILLSRPSPISEALVWLASHSSHSAGCMVRLAMTSVRRPAREYSLMRARVRSHAAASAEPARIGAKAPNTVLSAPFTYKTT